MKLVITIAKIVLFIGIWAAILYAGNQLIFAHIDTDIVSAAFFEFLRQAYALTAAIVIICIGILSFDGIHGFPKIVKRPWRDIILGLFVGVFWVAVTFILFHITDSIFPSDWTFPSLVAVWALAVALNVLTQEIILRGYVYTVVSRRYGAVAAIAVSSVVSLAVQGGVFTHGALPIIFTVAAAVLYGILRYYTKGLLAPVLTHAIWNLVGGLGLGLVNIGQGYPTIYAENVVGEDMISGGSTGFEGSALSVIVCILLIDLVAILIADASHRKSN
jgi:membrane protease YdiL (CAAX protease family)